MTSVHLLAVLLGVFAIVGGYKVSDELKVTLPHGGALEGKYMTSHRGQGIRAFLGIPFAEPPLGHLRFEPPYPKLPWTDVLDATDGKKSCPQAFGLSIIGSEDCLYVNVYAPLNPKSNAPLPVMVYFHGGGFVTGSADNSFYPPDFLLDHDVILVIGNYRLGALGFLSLETSEYPGNMGLKDQHLLLQWVQDNVGSFGGDPRQVTIFGESAGGASVGFHLISKLSYKLFQKAILQSGTQYAPWAFDHFGKNVENSWALGEAVGCPKGNSKDDKDTLVNCLREKTFEEIFEVSSKIFDPMAAPFLPNIEASSEGFIQKAPADYIRSIGLDVPIMVGLTRDEGACITALMLGSDSDEAWDMARNQLDNLIIQGAAISNLNDDSKEQLQKHVKEYYFKNDAFNRANVKNVTDFFSDNMFVASFDQFLQNRLVTNPNAADTFVYLFSHRGAITFPDILPSMGFPDVQMKGDMGVSHVDDLFYLFPMTKGFAPQSVPTTTDTYIQLVLTEMWVNFATNGQPTSSALDNVTWQAARSYPLDFLRIGNYGQPEKNLVGMDNGLFEERVNLWRKLIAITAKEATGKRVEL